MNERTAVLWAGFAGLAAAVVVGMGEFLLHFDTLARYGHGFEFFTSVSHERATFGHFLGVLGAPLYVLGAWHLFKMLKPANPLWARIGFLAAVSGSTITIVASSREVCSQRHLAMTQHRYRSQSLI